MATVPSRTERPAFEFSVGECCGALGDSVTVLPIVIALAATTAVSLPHVLVAFGVFQIVWGLHYGVPLSVEPMKALAALVVAGALSYAELVAAGALVGVALLAFGRGGVLSRFQSWVPTPAVRGVQLAVAALLAWTGVELAAEAPVLAALGLAVVAVLALAGHWRASPLAVLAVGVGLAVVAAGVPAPSLPGVPPVPAANEWLTVAAFDGAAAQLGMTLGNAAVATSLLCADLFDADVSPDDLSTSMGAMTLLAVPLGGVPMCHGSGGLAGKYAFGARTGGANVVLGVLYLLAALVATGAVVAAFPAAMLGVLLCAVAARLARAALDTGALGVTVGVGALGAATNVGLALLVGALAARHLARE